MTHHTIATQRATSTTAPSRPPPTRCARGAGRAIASEAIFTSRVVVVVVLSVVRSSGFWVVHRRAKRWQAPWWRINTPDTRALFLCSVRGLPWPLPSLPGTKRPDGRAGVTREVRHFAVLGRLWTTPGRGTNHLRTMVVPPLFRTFRRENPDFARTDTNFSTTATNCFQPRYLELREAGRPRRWLVVSSTHRAEVS